MGKEGGTTTETPVLISEAEMMERQKNYTTRMHDIAAACATFRSKVLNNTNRVGNNCDPFYRVAPSV